MIGDIRKFRFWCQKVLPLVYDDSLSYYEVLCKVVQYLNKVIEDVNSIPEYIDAVITERLSDEHLQELIEQFLVNLEKAISSNNEGTNTNSSADYNVGDMLWWKGELYKVIRHIDTGDTLIAGTNIELVSFDDLLNEFMDDIKHNISANDDGASTTATQNWTAGTWVWLNDVLYKAKVDIAQGTAYVLSGDNANVEQITVEGEIENEATAREEADGDLQTAIDDEATAREEADGTLQTAIDNEATARKNKPYINVKDYGAVGDGVTDDYNSFVEAYNACDDGSSIIVPYGVYNISANPDNHSKNVKWMFDYGTTFIGNGAKGGLDGVSNGFVSPASNPFNTVARTNSKIYNTMTSPVGGGICVDNYEVQSSNRTNKNIVGTITNGSAVMTNVSDIDDIAVGDSILAPTVDGWLDGSTRANSVRVVSIDRVNNTLTFGSTPAPMAIAGDGWCVPTPWDGLTQTANFVIRPRIWTVNQYLGLETAATDNIDEFGYLINGVFNVNGGVGNAVELDINLRGEASGGVTGLLLTGIGDANSPNYGIRIDRGGKQNWTTGIDINNCLFGIGISAYQPVLIRSSFYDNVTEQNISPLYGIIVDNIQDMVAVTRPLFGGEQIVNNAVGILLARATDTNPTGSYILCLDKARTTEVFKVDVNGEVSASGLKINQNFTAETVVCNYTFTIKDVNGTVLKVPCYFGG